MFSQTMSQPRFGNRRSSLRPQQQGRLILHLHVIISHNVTCMTHMSRDITLITQEVAMTLVALASCNSDIGDFASQVCVDVL